MTTEDPEAGPWDEPLQRAAEALDDGDPGAALSHLEGLPAADPEVACLCTEAMLELGRLPGARQALELGEFEEGDEERLWLEGQILLREWRTAEAERAFGELHENDPSPMALTALALCRELEGDFQAADAYLRAAQDLDPEAHPTPTRLQVEDFDRIVRAAIAELPQEFQAVLGHLRFLIEPMPAASLAQASAPGEIPPDLLGLFTGPTLGEMGEAHGQVPLVYLFQRNIERVARDEDELRLEIRTTLYHEIGHFLGHDEDGLESIGLG